MLETIREYGLEVLFSSGEMETTRQAHATFYITLAEECSTRVKESAASRVVGADGAGDMTTCEQRSRGCSNLRKLGQASRWPCGFRGTAVRYLGSAWPL